MKMFINLVISILVMAWLPAKVQSTASSIVECNREEIVVRASASFIAEKTSYYLPADEHIDHVIVFLSNSGKMFGDGCAAQKIKLSSGEDIFQLKLSPPFSNCGTASRVTFNANHSHQSIEFQNTVWWTGKQFRQHDILPFRVLDISCSYDDVTALRNAVKPICCDSQRVMTSHGPLMMKINYWIKLPYDDVMIRPLQPPFEFLVNEKLFVTVKLEGDIESNNLPNLALSDCWVSDQFLEANYTNSTKLISKGSALANHFLLQKAESKRANEKAFSIKIPSNISFSFFYLHCNGGGTLEPNSHPKKERGTRKSITLFATNGPVLVRRELHRRKQPLSPKSLLEGTTAAEESNKIKSLIVPVLLISINFVCVALMGVLCYFLARSVEAKRQKRLRKLTGESLFNTQDNYLVVGENSPGTSFLKTSPTSYKLKRSIPQNPDCLTIPFSSSHSKKVSPPKRTDTSCDVTTRTL